MSALHPQLRKLLENIVIDAREAAEKAARVALVTLAVHQEEAYASLSDSNKSLRRKLRVEARRLGDGLEKAQEGADPFPVLVAEVAYEQWHRLLFARFLAENDLLIHPDAQASVSIQDCADIAEEAGIPNADAWTVAAAYAAKMLPGIFRNDDPVLQLRFDTAGRLALENLLMKLPREVFLEDDSLGWVYQFWQAKRKDEVNKSGRKIGGADIAPVTQLFTEHYMVQFLLHNSLGAWWAARHPGESLPTDVDYLRRNVDGTPTAGPFSGWPERAAELKVLDPCCGSGHFLVAAFALLRRFRMMEEGLSEADAGNAVLRDNLFGLELDPRCTQIAVFAVCIAAWKAGGHRPLPIPNIACCGLAVGDRVYEWTRLAANEEDDKQRKALEATLRRLWHLFRDAPDLGSLIDPTRVVAEEHLFAVDWDKIAPLLEKALAKEREEDDPTAIFGQAAKGVLRAAELLTGKYTLVITNVPYLGRGNQANTLREYLETFHNAAKADLATAFVERCLTFCVSGGSTALVTPQTWLSLDSYKNLRDYLLKTKTWNLVAWLGSRAFETIGGEVVKVILCVLTNLSADNVHRFIASECSAQSTPDAKAEILRCGMVHPIVQFSQLKNPDSRVSIDSNLAYIERRLRDYVTLHEGMSRGDTEKYDRKIWELPYINLDRWAFMLNSPAHGCTYDGREHIIEWYDGKGDLAGSTGARITGYKAWGKRSVFVSRTQGLRATLSNGEIHAQNGAVLLPNNFDHLSALWAFCSSDEFKTEVRRLDQKIIIASGTLLGLPFDLNRWQQIADEQYPNGLPEPQSDDPTQWLFHGHPARSTDPLQVGMARLLGYRWSEHGLPSTHSGKSRQEEDGLDAFADGDGIACLPTVNSEPPAAQRLVTLLAAAYGSDWSPTILEGLLAKAGYGGKGLETWLRESFFAAHCRVFQNRPFLWHIWDGEKDGFGAIVNYHKLDRNNLDSLIYTYLGDWIERQRTDDDNGLPGAGRRLKAASDLQAKLKTIAHGEPPYDIYVRWKALHQHPIGWEPDLNDGVRLNIRPFVRAEILRVKKPSINWNKDKGNDPKPNLSGTTERHNDLHFTHLQKLEARRNAPRDEVVPILRTDARLEI